MARGRVPAALLAVAAAMVPLVAACSEDGATTTTACEPRTLGPDVAAEPDLPAEDADLPDAVASSFCSVFTVVVEDGRSTTIAPVLAAADGQCIGRRLVDSLGPDRVRELYLGAGPWSVLGLGITGLGPPTPIDEDEAAGITDALTECSDDFEQLLIRSVTQGAQEISDASASCVQGRLDDETARRILQDEIDRPYDDPSRSDAVPFAMLIQPLIDAMGECLTDAELEGLDWN